MNIIAIRNLNQTLKNGEMLFAGLNMQVNEGQKVALVGRNGSGKTTLLKALCAPNKHPEIQLDKRPYYIPQHVERLEKETIAQALGIGGKLEAIKAIEGGDSSPHNFDIVGEDWDILAQAKAALSKWGVSQFDVEHSFHTLSGGERVKVLLAGITLHNPELVLLDEPTNHLDYSSRETLYEYIKETTATLVIVTHDRTLLNLLTDIYELEGGEIRVYSGNYEFYVEQKELERGALMRQLDSQRQELRRAKRTRQEVFERRQRSDSRGAAKTAKMGMPRIMADMMKGTAERTTAGVLGRHDTKIGSLEEDVRELQERAQTHRELKVDISQSSLHRGKIMAEAKAINFSYGAQNLWQEPLDFIITSGERVLIEGKNGSGKSTLIDLLMSKKEVTEGNLMVAEFSALYLDQEYSMIDGAKTVYEQAQSYNYKMPEHDVKILLTRSQFENDSWDKSCAVLSGGEKMKLSLCSLTIANQAPDVLILDEPTNNLDIQSLEILSRAVNGYVGTLIVVSHDRYFVEELGITKRIRLE